VQARQEIGETLRAQHQFPHHEKGPSLADDV